jgi:uncharacterized protein
MKITIFAHPNSKKSGVEMDLFGSLHIYVKEPPLEGRANLAVKKALAEHLNLPKSQIILIRGEKSKQKTFEIG